MAKDKAPFKTSTRALKEQFAELLQSSEYETISSFMSPVPPVKIINFLFSFLYNTDPVIKWNAVTAMGAVVAELGRNNLESARIILRRLMWNLNDESGGIGWGSAEAMGEILANSRPLASEYSRILISYIMEDGNYQERDIMFRGVLWGIGRLAMVRPELVKESVEYILPYLESQDPFVRGHAAWVLGLLNMKQANKKLGELRGDDSEFHLFINMKRKKLTVSKMVEESLNKCQ